MKRVKQTIIDFEKGDCFRACVASIFELPIGSVPNFMMDGKEKFSHHLESWCNRLGLKAIDITTDDLSVINECYVIAGGASPRNKNFNHAVVWLNGKIIHDPHPSNDGINGDPKMFTVFIIKDASKYLNKKRVYHAESI